MHKLVVSLLISCSLSGVGFAKKLPEIPLDENWKQGIAERAPKAPQVKPSSSRKVLIFSLATGFKHWCIPHTEAVIEILGKESGAYESVSSKDIEMFREENLKEFDAVVLNNTCPARGKRDMFYDVLVQLIGKEGKKYADMPLEEREVLANQLYQNLVNYVAEGGGLVLLHGAIANFSESAEFSEIVGASFQYHPAQQEVTLIPVIPGHPLLKPFDGEPFVHYDEPYVLGGAYDKFNFAPMLEMDTSKLQPAKLAEKLGGMKRYVSWIKPYKKGRVFFSSPSHNAQSFHQPELLGFLLNGMQYAIGDLECEDGPLK